MEFIITSKSRMSVAPLRVLFNEKMFFEANQFGTGVKFFAKLWEKSVLSSNGSKKSLSRLLLAQS